MPRRGDSKKESSRRKSGKQTTVGKPSTSRATQSETYESKPRKATPLKTQASASKKTSGNGGDGKAKGGGILSRAISAVAGALKRRTGKKATAAAATNPVPTRKNKGGTAKAARVARREPDIPMDQIADTYTPTQTSLKAGFRATGEDRSRDQDYAKGAADTRWNDEDRMTNKSGDPRIGTHGRTYEPGEKTGASRSDKEK